MSEIKLLAGSLSNDLMRVASLTHAGSIEASLRFLMESKRWSNELLKHELPDYINSLVKVVSLSSTEIDRATAERYLMYGVLLQNFALHLKD